ncbi:MAG: hypothetical protein AAF708_22570 [Deinococcota bacterium]
MLKLLRFSTVASLLLVLAACSQTAVPEPSPNVLGMGTFSIDTANGLVTASLSDSFFSINGGIELVNVINGQLRFVSANTASGSGRVVITRAVIRNRSGADINNLVLLAMSVEDGDNSVISPFSNVSAGGTDITDQASIAAIKPANARIFDNELISSDFVAYAEGDLDESLRTALQQTAKVPVEAVFPFGFKVGDGTISDGATAEVTLGFFLPDAPAVGSSITNFTFTALAVEDTLNRITQGPTEIVLNGNEDTNYSTASTTDQDVLQRYEAASGDKTLVLIGPYTRNVAQSDIDAGIFTLLPDIRIMGTADNPVTTLLDSGSSNLPTIVGN